MLVAKTWMAGTSPAMTKRIGGVSMIDHVSVPVRDLAAATRFYEAVLGTLGIAKLEARPATVGFGKKYPEFWINLRAEMMPAAATSGAHVCLNAGGSSDGAPGLRPQHGEGYYAAFIRDLDGNRIEAVTFTAAE
jgi:catechol 2,3-dioxygenase-like lactoylglutathione lyase family enzyme